MMSREGISAHLKTPEAWFAIVGALLLLCILMLSGRAHAAETLTLQRAFSEAKAKSPVYRQARAAAQEASWRPLEALSGNLPRIAVSATHFFGIEYQYLDISLAGGPPIHFPLIAPQTIFNLGVYWTVFDGLQTPYGYAAARADARAADLELERADFQLNEQVRSRFYEALASRLLADVAEQNVITLRDHLAKTKEMLALGSATRFDLLRVQTQLEEAIPERTTANDNVILSRKNLAVAMGYADDSRPLSGELPTPDEKDVSADLQLDVSQRPDLAALTERANAASDLHAAAAGGWLPRVGLQFEHQYYNNVNSSLSGPYGHAFDVGMTLTWNIFDGGATIARQNQSEYRQQQAEAASDAANIGAPTDFETSKRRFYADVENYHARKRAVDTARESVRLAKLGYSAGTRTSTDVLDAEVDLFRAGAGVVQAQLAAERDLIGLELALGRKLKNGR